MPNKFDSLINCPICSKKLLNSNPSELGKYCPKLLKHKDYKGSHYVLYVLEPPNYSNQQSIGREWIDASFIFKSTLYRICIYTKNDKYSTIITAHYEEKDPEILLEISSSEPFKIKKYTEESLLNKINILKTFQ